METIQTVFPLLRGPHDKNGLQAMGALSITGQKVTDGYCAPTVFQKENEQDLFVGISGQGAPISSIVIDEESPVFVGFIRGNGVDTSMNIQLKNPEFPIDTLWIRIYQQSDKRILEMMTIYTNGSQATIQCDFAK